MAWEWSHTQEAYEAAYENVRRLPPATLRMIYAEWHADTEDGFDEDAYEAALERADDIDDDALADFVWEKASELRTCDNGGHACWVCPDGCHTVPFD